MSQYTLEELLARWKQDDVTAEQMVGQLLLAMIALQQRVRELERQRPPSAESPPNAKGTPRKPRRPA